MRETVIVVPCYNEQGRLAPEAFLDTCTKDGGIGFLFVDDGSTDATAARLQELCAQAPEACRSMSLSVNAGKAEAVRQGLLAASGEGCRYTGYWDCDRATALTEIAVFRDALERTGRAMALGSRVRLLGRQIHRKPVRHYLGRVFASIVSLSLRMPVYDTQCGAKMFRNDAVLREVLATPFSSRWIFDVEILARYRRACGEEFAIEIPLQRWEDVGGSKLKPGDFLVSGVDLLKILRQVYLD